MALLTIIGWVGCAIYLVALLNLPVSDKTKTSASKELAYLRSVWLFSLGQLLMFMPAVLKVGIDRGWIFFLYLINGMCYVVFISYARSTFGADRNWTRRFFLGCILLWPLGLVFFFKWLTRRKTIDSMPLGN